MVERYTRLLGVACILDGILIGITVPATKLLMYLMLPPGMAGDAQMLWTYGLVVFGGLLGITVFVLWIFESMYGHLFTFWQLMIAMVLVFLGFLYWNKR